MIYLFIVLGLLWLYCYFYGMALLINYSIIGSRYTIEPTIESMTDLLAFAFIMICPFVIIYVLSEDFPKSYGRTFHYGVKYNGFPDGIPKMITYRGYQNAFVCVDNYVWFRREADALYYKFQST